MVKEFRYTECGKRIFFVGVGICGLGVHQVEIIKDTWKLGKREENLIKMFGSGDVYRIRLETDNVNNKSSSLNSEVVLNG